MKDVLLHILMIVIVQVVIIQDCVQDIRLLIFLVRGGPLGLLMLFPKPQSQIVCCGPLLQTRLHEVI